MPRLTEWRIGFDVSYLEPQDMPCLLGFVCNDIRFEDGCYIKTSRIKKVENCGDHKEVTTKSGTVYDIYKNDVSEPFSKDYPDAYEMLSELNE